MGVGVGGRAEYAGAGGGFRADETTLYLGGGGGGGDYLTMFIKTHKAVHSKG